jgi:hypothetical protein
MLAHAARDRTFAGWGDIAFDSRHGNWFHENGVPAMYCVVAAAGDSGPRSGTFRLTGRFTGTPIAAEGSGARGPAAQGIDTLVTLSSLGVPVSQHLSALLQTTPANVVPPSRTREAPIRPWCSAISACAGPKPPVA